MHTRSINQNLNRGLQTLYRAATARLSAARSHLCALKHALLATCGYGSTGYWGERIAARHIQRAGALVISSNWIMGKLEADIIAIDKRTLVIIEVKTRHESLMSSFPAIDAVTRSKVKRLSTLANGFIRRYGPLCRRLGVRSYRLDTVEVYYRRSCLRQHRPSCVSWHKNYIAPPS